MDFARSACWKAFHVGLEFGLGVFVAGVAIGDVRDDGGEWLVVAPAGVGGDRRAVPVGARLEFGDEALGAGPIGVLRRRLGDGGRSCGDQDCGGDGQCFHEVSPPALRAIRPRPGS